MLKNTKRNLPFNASYFKKKKYDSFGHGFDYLSLSLSDYNSVNDFFNTRVKTLDTDNSNFGVLDIFGETLSIAKIKSPNGDAYIYSIVFNSISIPIFNINIFDVRNVAFSGILGNFTFYGSYYRILELDGFGDNFVNSITEKLKDLVISRADYRFDFLSKDIKAFPEVEDVFLKIRKGRKVRKWEKTGTNELESFAIGNKKNKNSFIRVYNKQIELQDNLKKLFLYGDVLTELKTFHRVEYEFGIKFTGFHKFKDIDILKNKIYSYTGFKDLSFKNYYKPRNIVDLSDELQKLRYIKQVVSMCKNLKQNGIDVYTLLLEHNIF